MPLLTAQVVEEILTIARRSSKGVTTSEIQAALAERPDDRTLRRWVATIVETGTLVPVASPDGIRYLAEPLSAESTPPPPSAPTPGPSTLPGVPLPSPFTSPAAPNVVPGAPTAGDPFDAFFASSLTFVVAGYMPRPTAFSYLHTHAASRALDPATQKAFVLRARQRYDQLTEAEADAGGVLPEVYHAWREVYPLGGTPPQPSPAPAAPVAAAVVTPDPAPAEDPTVPAANPQPTLADAPSATPEPEPEPAPIHRPPSPAAAPSAPPPPAPPAIPASRFDAERTLAKQATQVIGDALARVAPNLSPELRVVVGAAVALFLFGSLTLVGSYPLVMLGIALATILGIVLFALYRHRSSGSRGTPLPRVDNVASSQPSPTPPDVPATASEWTAPPSVRPLSPVPRPLSPVPRPLSPVPRRRVKAVLFLILAAVIAVPAAIWAYRRSQRPSERALSDYLVSALSPLPLRVAGLTVTYGKPTAVGCEVTYQARFETTEPLYHPVKWTDYVRTLPPAERASLPDASATRLLTLVTTQTPPGTNAMAYGRVTAWRRAGEWVFTGAPPRLELTPIRGERLPVGDDVYALDSPADLTRLRARLAELLAPSASAPNPDPVAPSISDVSGSQSPTPPRPRQPKTPASKTPRTAATPAPETAPTHRPFPTLKSQIQALPKCSDEGGSNLKFPPRGPSLPRVITPTPRSLKFRISDPRFPPRRTSPNLKSQISNLKFPPRGPSQSSFAPAPFSPARSSKVPAAFASLLN